MNTTKPKSKFSRLLSFLLLKLSWAAKPSLPAPVPAPPTAPRLGKKILIIDDDAVILHILSHKLSARGYDIKTAVGPEEALGALREAKPDLILLDLVFPPDVSFSGAANLDGFGMMRWLRASGLGKQIPIFIISSEDPDQCKERWPAKGPEVFFQKPIDHDRLFSSIRRTLWKDANAVKSEPTGPEGVGSTSCAWGGVAPRSVPVPAPQQRERPTNEMVYDSTGESLILEPESILMVEDDVEFGKALQALLESHSFRVARVTSGAEGVRQIMDSDFDIILCDLVMPNLPGDMFYLAVERTKPQLCKRFVFMTGHRADPKWDAFIRKVGGVAIWKPFPLANLLAAIQAVLARNPPNRPRVSGTAAPQPVRPPTTRNVLLTIKMAEEPNPPPL